MDVQELMNRIAQNFSVSRAFGPAYEKDGTLVIPVALVSGGGGGGENSLPTETASFETDSSNEPLDGGTSQDHAASGSGVGFGGAVLPLGVYVVNDDQVRWVPVVNVAAVIAGLCVLRLLGVMGKRRKHRRV